MELATTFNTVDTAQYLDLFTDLTSLFLLTDDNDGEQQGKKSYSQRRHEWYVRWTQRWQVCNGFCMTYILMDLSVLVAHWIFMMVPMEGWAEGNFFLLSMTLMTTFKSQASIMLLVGEPVWMMAPKWQRMLMFVLSLISVFSFFGQFVAWTKGYFTGNTPLDSFSEIISAYMMVLRFGDLVPSLYIFLFDGLGQSEYSLFNKNYGNWEDVVLEAPHSSLEEEHAFFAL